MAANIHIIILSIALLASFSYGESPGFGQALQLFWNNIVVIPPEQILKVQYPNVSVEVGKVIIAGQTVETPKVSWDANSDAYYFLMETDLGTDNWPPLQHWLVVNIPGNDVSKGETIYDYLPSGPPEGTGRHRYAFYVYQQEKKLSENEYSTLVDGRRGKVQTRIDTSSDKILEVLQKKGYRAVAANFLFCDYDETVTPNVVAIVNKYA